MLQELSQALKYKILEHTSSWFPEFYVTFSTLSPHTEAKMSFLRATTRGFFACLCVAALRISLRTHIQAAVIDGPLFANLNASDPKKCGRLFIGRFFFAVQPPILLRYIYASIDVHVFTCEISHIIEKSNYTPTRVSHESHKLLQSRNAPAVGVHLIIHTQRSRRKRDALEIILLFRHFYSPFPPSARSRKKSKQKCIIAFSYMTFQNIVDG
jgi:hypothetical protein